MSLVSVLCSLRLSPAYHGFPALVSCVAASFRCSWVVRVVWHRCWSSCYLLKFWLLCAILGILTFCHFRWFCCNLVFFMDFVHFLSFVRLSCFGVHLTLGAVLL